MTINGVSSSQTNDNGYNVNVPLLNGIGGSSGGGLPPSICTGLQYVKTGTTVKLRWHDPKDTIVDEQYLCTWAGTKIVKKYGSYPENENDGTLVINNKVRDQYYQNWFTELNVEDGWYYAAFPYSTNGVVCYNPDHNRFTDATIYEFVINTTDSNPSTAVSYPEGSINANYRSAAMNFGGSFNYGDWEGAFFPGI